MKYGLKVTMGAFVGLVMEARDCPILMYHRVLPHGAVTGTLDDNVVVTPEAFEANVRFLLKRFAVVSLADVMVGRQQKKPSFVITFDDGWLDTYEVAFPILKRLGVPATVFLPTAYIGTSLMFWYDRVERLVRQWVMENGVAEAHKWCQLYFDIKTVIDVGTEAKLVYEAIHSMKPRHPRDIEYRLKQAEGRTFGSPQPISPHRQLMDWDEVRRMGAAGVTFGSHGISHSILPNLSYEEQKEEIHGSRRMLRSQKVNYVDCISFPNGNYNQETLDLSGEAGYQLFVSASMRPCGTGMSRRLAHRIGVPFSLANDEGLLKYTLVKAKCTGRMHRLAAAVL